MQKMRPKNIEQAKQKSGKSIEIYAVRRDRKNNYSEQGTG